MTVVKRERSVDTFDDSHDGLLSNQSFSSDYDDDSHKRWVVSDITHSKGGNSVSTSTTLTGTGSPTKQSSSFSNSTINTNTNKYYDQQPLQLESSVMKYKEEMRKRRMKKSNKKSEFCKYTVDRVQGILLPQRFSSYIPVASSSTTTTTLNDSDNDDDGYDDHSNTAREYKESSFLSNKYPSNRIPLIKGLERVTSGAQPASEVVATCGMKPHRFIWFIISSCLCDMIQFFIDLTFYYVFQIKEPTVCWVLGYALSIIVRHTSHRYLVFGNYVGGYWYSLLRMYTGYSMIMALSTLLNWVLTHNKKMELKHYTAWMITLVGTNVMNYFLLRYLWKMDCCSRSRSSSPCGRKGKKGLFCNKKKGMAGSSSNCSNDLKDGQPRQVV